MVMQISRDIHILKNLNESTFIARNHKEWSNLVALSLITELATAIFFLVNIPKSLIGVVHTLCTQPSTLIQKIQQEAARNFFFFSKLVTFPVSLFRSWQLDLSSIADTGQILIMKRDLEQTIAERVRIREQDMRFAELQFIDQRQANEAEHDRLRAQLEAELARASQVVVQPVTREETNLYRWVTAQFLGKEPGYTFPLTKPDIDRVTRRA